MSTTPHRKLLRRLALAALGWAALAGAPLAAQSLETVDPTAAIDGDLATPAASAAPAAAPAEAPGDQPVYAASGADYTPPDASPPQRVENWNGVPAATPAAAAGPEAPGWQNPNGDAGAGTMASQTGTYQEDDLIGAAEGVFGKGAEGVAGMICKLLADQGEPNAYIVGREAGGAFVFGLRYGSGTLHHKIEGEMPVYWTGPSIGFDAGANAGNTFVLVYNLYDTEVLFKRYPAGEGQAYVVGGLTASYLRRKDVVLIPIRVGAGLRLGVNAGYMKFSKKQRWLPF